MEGEAAAPIVIEVDPVLDAGELPALSPRRSAAVCDAVGTGTTRDEGAGLGGLPGAGPGDFDALVGGASVAAGAGGDSGDAAATVGTPDPLALAAEVDPALGRTREGAPVVVELPVAEPDIAAAAFAGGRPAADGAGLSPDGAPPPAELPRRPLDAAIVPASEGAATAPRPLGVAGGVGDEVECTRRREETAPAICCPGGDAAAGPDAAGDVAWFGCRGVARGGESGCCRRAVPPPGDAADWALDDAVGPPSGPTDRPAPAVGWPGVDARFGFGTAGDVAGIAD